MGPLYKFSACIMLVFMILVSCLPLLTPSIAHGAFWEDEELYDGDGAYKKSDDSIMGNIFLLWNGILFILSIRFVWYLISGLFERILKATGSISWLATLIMTLAYIYYSIMLMNTHFIVGIICKIASLVLAGYVIYAITMSN